MADAPERMTLQPCPTYGWDRPDRVKHVVDHAVEYVRADLTPPASVVEAMKLPEVQAVVKCLDREKSLIWIIENTVQVLIRDLALEMLGQQRAALTAWRDSQRPPSEYEQKLAAMKKDFPNGI